MKQKTNFIRFIQLWGIILIIGIGVSVVSVNVFDSYYDFNLRNNQMRTKYIARQKQMIKQEVDQVVDIINYQTAQSKMLTKKKLRSRVYEAYSIARNIYLQNKAHKTRTEIKQMIVNALRPIRFARNTGYYFINGFDGKPVLFPSKPALKGGNLSAIKDIYGQYITRNMIEIVKKSIEGFYEYHWTKPGEHGNDFLKIAFVKLFKPYNWLISASLYVKDIENKIKTNLLENISRIRFGREGYIFVNRFNGDALISDGKIISVRKKLWEVFDKNPGKTKNIFKKEYNAALKPHGGYIYYSLIKLTDSDKESPKASFICGIPNLKWIVGAGVYLDDVENQITIMQTALNRGVKIKLFYSFLIMAGIVGFFLFLFNILTRRLQNDFSLFISFFERASISDEPINRDLIQFDELDRMAGYANNMLNERMQYRQDLLNEKERLFVTIRSIGDGVITSDKSGKVELMNRVAEQLTGWKSQDAEKKILTEVFDIVNSTTRKKARNPVARVLANGKITNLANHTLLISKDGNEYQIADSAAPIKERNGKVIGVVLVFRDITKEYQMQEELQTIQKLKSVGLLAGGIAHDFNNIMTGLFGNISIVKTKLGKDHPEFKFLEQAEKAMDRSIRLTKQLLTFARGGKPILEKIAMDAFVEEIVRFDLSGSNVKPFFNLSDDLWMVEIDKGQIQQVFSNLTINAIQAMPNGGNLYISIENIEIAESMVADLKQGKYIKIIVKDEGCGIEKAHLDRIFDPYFTTRGAGNGLGLATTYSIIKKHGGHISAFSQPDKGAVFTFYLPALRSVKTPEDGKNTETPLALMHDIAQYKAKILIMDDNEAIRMVVSEMLETMGFASETGSNGDQTIKMYMQAMDNDEPFDAVIMDLTIPGGMGGKEAVHELLMIDPKACVIVSSGYADDPVLAYYKEYGFKGIITKPYTMGNLKKVLKKVLKK